MPIAIMNGTEMMSEANQTYNPLEPQGLDVLYSLSYKWLLPIAILLVISVGSLFSRLQDRKPVDPSLVVPVCDYLCCCIPETFKRKMRCGVKYSDTEKDTAEGALTEEVMLDLMPVPGRAPKDI
ncbi:uncharacterized protein LOC110456201 [Mizuhopecten yessoensis]|uniref:uncharacterized protein LOC110456201 n=1 Tax=Mizuhopecten yessoensis TaxID=6573 RepID=UPI000B45E5C6|nr:uncharacterized protein LOC110456201 [Mizuhopecten yessoensis]